MNTLTSQADELADISRLQSVAKKYHPLLYISKLISILQDIFPIRNFEHFTKPDLHKLINDLLIEHYPGESLFKYKLFQQYINKRNIVAAYEIKVNNSRADFLTVNGHTTCFEIKSAYDNFSKFEKQAKDYLKVFEFNYLVVDHARSEKAADLIPPDFGLWTFQNGKYKRLKKAGVSTSLDPQAQLGLLNKRELTTAFPGCGASLPTILESHTSDAINSVFKKVLKSRYATRWEFVARHQKTILPIDLQFFFNTNIDPDRIYSI